MRRLWRRFCHAHRRGNRENLQGWVDLIGGYLTLAAMAAGAVFAVWSWVVDHGTDKQALEAARNGPDLKADLKLAKVSAHIGKGIKGTEADASSPNSAKPQKIDIVGPHVDITVQNLATAPSLITEAKATFRNSFYLEPCYPTGGPLVSTATYSLTVPDNQPATPGTRSHKVPFTLTAELTHNINANSYEKFTLTAGPETIVEGASPWVGVFNLELVHDSGKKLKFGPIAVINAGGNGDFYPDGDTWYIAPGGATGCNERNARAISKVLETPQVTASRELEALDRAFRSSSS